MRIFMDTEFTGLHQHTSLISIGLVAENGDVFYAERIDFDRGQVDDWVSAHVLTLLSGDLPKLDSLLPGPQHFGSGNAGEIAGALQNWFARFGGKDSVEIWADVLAWDWVLFCEFFGGALKIPEQLHYIPRDLSTLMALRGIEPGTEREKLGKVTFKYPPLKLARHHALYDALLEKDIYENIR